MIIEAFWAKSTRQRWFMEASALKWPLILVCLFLPALCHARDCWTKTATAPVHAAIGSGPGCALIVEEKLCAPPGKAPVASAVKELKASPNVEAENQIRNLDGGCIEAKVTVRSRSVVGPPIWEYCEDGTYDALVELSYCQ